MRTDTVQLLRLDDYQPFPFDIPSVSLRFELRPSATRVSASLEVRRKPGVPADAPLELDGKGLRRVSVRVDGEDWPEDRIVAGGDTLRLLGVPDRFTLDTVCEVDPSSNTELSGLYISGGRFCTQCEAEGFRRITWWPDRPDVMSRFDVRLEADADVPVLLSNGTPGASGALPDGRHYAEWSDPHPKPSYLFALCAGEYDILRDSFTTRSGREVALAVHVDPGQKERARWAMDCLKASMRWDEEVYGREYDLGAFNIVAVRDFNFGAMENKGLNIFNSAYVLADEDTATDADFEAIEAIVAHEYFHNWTGNRITCRDWFQLCLKEGLTVFRDAQFSADMRSAPVERIKEVQALRTRQFPEDAGPLAHPVRPREVGSVENLYTATVYEKGSALIRMLRALIGEDTFARGMDLYFERHDGEAVTLEAFYRCFEDASGTDLSDFLRWYAQPGTPVIEAELGEGGTLSLRQHVRATDAEPDPRPLPVPLRLSVLGEPGSEKTVLMGADEMTVELGGGAAPELVSLNRNFDAPVILRERLTPAQRLERAARETDPFNAWDGLQTVMEGAILAEAGAPPEGGAVSLDAAAEAAAGAALRASGDDPAYAALLAAPPALASLFLAADTPDAARLDGLRKGLSARIADALGAEIGRVLDQPEPSPFRPDAAQAGRRAWRGALMAASAARGAPDDLARLESLIASASSLTQRLHALSALCAAGPEAAADALAAFRVRHQGHDTVMDKWFAVQSRQFGAEAVAALQDDPLFDWNNPNQVRSVAGAFGAYNLAAFHAADGSGHRFVAEAVRTVNARNGGVAARLLSAFESWRRLPEAARASARGELEALASEGLSKNPADILRRILGSEG